MTCFASSASPHTPPLRSEHAQPGRGVPPDLLVVVTDGGKTFTFRLRKGIFFTPDPAFKSVRREMIAADVAYSIKRFMDPKNRSPWRFLFDGKMVDEPVVARARALLERADR